MSQEAIHTGSGDMGGNMSFKFREGHSIYTLAEKIFAQFNADDHEPIALRLYYGKETIITLYALDKVRQENSTGASSKIPVRKFKAELDSLGILLTFVEEINFTAQAGNFPLEDMDVINR